MSVNFKNWLQKERTKNCLKSSMSVKKTAEKLKIYHKI